MISVQLHMPQPIITPHQLSRRLAGHGDQILDLDCGNDLSDMGPSDSDFRRVSAEPFLPGSDNKWTDLRV